MTENAFKELDLEYCIAVVSGGMDSTTLAYACSTTYKKVDLLSFDYGQRHKKELEYAGRTAARLMARFDIVDLTEVGNYLSGSALLGDMDVPHGHYEEETMRSTVVPNRNAIMLNVAAGIAVSRGAGTIATGVHSGDHAVYPDCRPEFINALAVMLRIATDQDIKVDAPFVMITKAEIAEVGQQLGVRWEGTWSCYEGGKVHCGRCSTCVERIEAFSIANITDPTTYADADYYIELRSAGKVR